MKKLIIIAVILLISFPIFAQNAVIKEIKGKVEIKTPGGVWTVASAGDEMPAKSSISTGFGSSAVIEVGASVLTVDALTRMELEDLIQEQGTQTTALFLRVGKVKAEVTRDRDLTHDFKLRSPSSTAAVRGTAFTFDGTTLTVERGAVAFISESLERELLVGQGEESKVSFSGKQSSPFGNRLRHASTAGSTVKQQNSNSQSGSSQNSGAGHHFGNIPFADLYGDVTITVTE